MRIAFFPGCTAPVKTQEYELSTRRVTEELGIELVDLPFSCCGFPLRQVNQWGSICLSAYNLALAEKEGLNVVCLCSACRNTLENALKAVEDSKSKNQLFKMNIKLEGRVRVKHFVDLLYNDIGINRIKSSIKKPLSLKVVLHPGCHFLRSGKQASREKLKALVEALGLKVLDYPGEDHCCGGALLAAKPDLAYKIAGLKLKNMFKSKPDAAVVICPFCGLMLKSLQDVVASEAGLKERLPVYYYPQLLGLALGIPPKQLGVEEVFK